MTSSAVAGVQSGRCVVHLFGHARLDVGDEALTVRGPIKRGLVSMLALDLGRSVHVDQLVDGLWDEGASADVLASLRVHISQLRTFLDREVPGGRQYVEGRYPLYRLSDQVTSDFASASALRDRAFDRLADDPEGALGDLDAARRLVVDDPLAEIRHLPFAGFAAASLRAFQLQLADDYAEVATAVWGSSDPAVLASDAAGVTRMDERRWRLFNRLVDAPTETGAPEAGALAAAARPRDLELAADALETPDPAEVALDASTLPSDLAARMPPVFVGRQRERALVLDLQAEVRREGRTRVAEIVGPGGVGKTSLAASVASELAAHGAGVQYASWSGSELAAHAPFVAAGLIKALEHDQTNPPVGQVALAAEIIDRIRERTREPGGLVLVFDDVHRLPVRYHPVIGRILECPDIAVLAVVIQRPESERPLLEEILPSDTQRVRLLPFSERELDELARAIGDRASSGTGRNLPWVAGLLLAGPGATPDDRIGEAIEQLASGERELLERLALAPDGLMLRTLQHASPVAPLETLHRLRGLVADGLVTEQDGRPARFHVAHELIGEAVRARAGPALCIERSASLHDALEATGAPLGERVQHAIVGADLLGARSDQTVTAAAKLLIRQGAFADAIALAEAAHESGVAREPRSQIVIDAARFFAQAALGERSDATHRLLDLAQDAADIEDWDTVATLMQWRTRFGVADPLAGKLLESALIAVDNAEPRLRFEILWGLVFQTMFASGRVADASPLVREMIEIANELRDSSLRVRALACEHWMQAVVGASPGALDALSDEITAYAEETNDEQLIAGAYAGRIGNALRQHDLAGVDLHANVLRRARQPHTRWRAHLVDAMLQLDHLDLDGAESTIGAAARYAGQHGLIIRGDESIAQAFILAWVRGNLGQFRDLLEGRDPDSPGYLGWTAALALARLAAGDHEAAVALGTELAATSHPISDWDWYAFIAAALLTDVAYFTGSPTIAEHVIDQLAPMSGRRVMLGLAVDLGPVDRYLALAHATLGAHEMAAALRDQAREQAGCRLWSTRLECDEHATGRIVEPTDGAWTWIETRFGA